MSASSSHLIEKKLDIAQQDSEQSIQQCIVFAAPLGIKEGASKEIFGGLITQPVKALEKHGCKVTLIGDGIRDLNQSDMDQLLNLLKSYPGRTLLYITAHGDEHKEIGHAMRFGVDNDYVMRTTDLLKTIATNLKDKPIDIVSTACFSAHACDESASSILPIGSNFVGFGYEPVEMLYIFPLMEALLNQPVKKDGISADKMLQAYLTIPVFERELNPEICSVRNSKKLIEKLLGHIGERFNDAEKESVYRELSDYISTDILDERMARIEKQKQNYFSDFYTTSHRVDLAIAHAASKVSIQKSIPSQAIKTFSHELWQKNEKLKQQQSADHKQMTHSFNLKTIPRMIDMSAEKKGVKQLEDLMWQQLLGKSPEIKPESPSMTAWERSLHPADFAPQKMEHLKEGIDIYHSLRLPSVFKEHKNASSFLLHEPTAIDTHTPVAAALFHKLAPSAKEGLQQHSDYLLYRVQKLNQQSMLASDFMRTVAFKDELYRLQIDSGLSSEQTQLLVLYTNGRYAEHKASISISAKPNPELLKTSLQILQASISRDLSLHPDKSAIFQAVQQTSQKSHEIIQGAHSFEGHDEVFTQRIQQTRTEITAVTGLCSQVAKLSGSPKVARQITAIGNGASQLLGGVQTLSKWKYLAGSEKITAVTGFYSQVASLSGSPIAARKITAMGSGASQWLGGVAALSMGHPLMGLVGIGSAVCSFFGGLFGDDDDGDDGMSILSSQISEVHHDMIKGFNEILSQQVDIARGLSKQIASAHQQTMSRFDHVDYNLEIIQQQINQTYQYLTAQNSRISQQISLLSQQVSETEINILKGLQAVYADIVRCLQIISEGMAKGFHHLDEQLCKGFDHLDQEVQLLTREMRAKMAEQMLFERQYFESLNLEQAHQSKELKQHSNQLDAIRQHEMQAQKKQNEMARKKKESELTKYAERILLDNFPIETFDKSKLDYALSKAAVNELTADKSLLTPEEILNELGGSHQWQEIDSFDYINLLYQSERKIVHPLVHLPTQQKNLLAIVKWLMQKKSVTPEQLSQLKEQVEKNRDILRFCHALAKPDAIKIAFSEISKNVTALGGAIEKQLVTYTEEFSDKCQQRLQHAWEQHEINRVRLKKGESKEVLECLVDRMKQPLEIKIFDEKVTITHDKPQAYFVSPTEKESLQYALPLTMDKLPSLPKEILELEALGVGWIHFSYRFDSEKKQLEVIVEFQLSTGKSYPLVSKQITVNNENDIANRWRQFKWPVQEKIKLSEEDYNALTKIHVQSLQELRLQLNYKLQQDLSRPALQAPIEAVEASVGLLHAKFKLMFESFYLNKDQTLYRVLQSCLTTDKLKQLLAGYQGDGNHPFLSFKNAKKWYDELSNHIIDALTKRTLYVDNVTLTNALLLLDNALLEFMPKDERLDYLNHILETLPDPAKTTLLILRGTLFATEKHDMASALADYRQASVLNPDDNQIRSKYADALFALGDSEAAIREYTEILERMRASLASRGSLSPQLRTNLYINEGVILLSRGDAYFASGYPAAAFGDYQIACQLLSDQPEALYKLGLSYQALDKLDLAIDNYQKAIKISPDDDKIKDRLANCLVRTNKKSEAFVLYQLLLKNYPTSLDYKFQCAQLCPPEDKRCFAWVKEKSKDPKASVDDLLVCGELYAKKGDLAAAKLIYFKIKDKINSVDQIKRCVDLCLIFKDQTQSDLNKYRLLVAEGLFKQSSIDANPEKEILKTSMQYNRGSI